MTETKRRSAELLSELVEALIEERIDHGEIDLATMSFAEIEQMGHELGQRLAAGFDHQLTGQQAELCCDDWCCPTCGLECEAIRTPRTIKTIDGPTEIIELKSYCPKCRRSFFPQQERQQAGNRNIQSRREA